jgi:uncharacterized membrane protein
VSGALITFAAGLGMLLGAIIGAVVAVLGDFSLWFPLVTALAGCMTGGAVATLIVLMRDDWMEDWW